MRPIRIDRDLKEFSKEFSDKLFISNRPDFISPTKKLDDLISKYDSTNYPIENQILKLIKVGYESKTLLYLTPREQEKYVRLVNQKYSDYFSNKHGGRITFANEIVDALRYDYLQKNNSYMILDYLGIKACPYCNAMLTVNVKKGDKKNKARCQLDHYFPKSKYPFLSISFFNLIPCCGNCNQAKSDDTILLGKGFHLYADDTPEDPFYFKLNDIEVVKELVGVSSGDITFEFTHSNDKHRAFVNAHNDTYHIQALYNTQKDIIEELIWKSQVYGKQKIDELSKILGVSESEVKRMIIGNYSTSEEIHKRPLAKFVQDIGKQLELIEKIV